MFLSSPLTKNILICKALRHVKQEYYNSTSDNFISHLEFVLQSAGDLAIRLHEIIQEIIQEMTVDGNICKTQSKKAWTGCSIIMHQMDVKVI